MIIVSTPLRLLLYPILELSPVREGYKPLAVPVTPLATYAENVSGGSNSIWNTLCSHHSGRLSTMTYSQTGRWWLCALSISAFQPASRNLTQWCIVLRFS